MRPGRLLSRPVPRPLTAASPTILELGEAHPRDAGVLAALLLNRLTLRAGEAIYLPAGNLHLYLHGTAVEILANSDNILRCGLTPKHVDVPELLRVVDFACGEMPDQCGDVDQACYALITDLKRRGMLDDTLVIWGGEFGRTIYSQGGLSKTNYGRDHHPRCFTVWMAGGGTKGGTIYGETDDFSYNIVKDPCHIRDFHATILHLLGIDHSRFSYRFQGLDQRLTGVEKAEVIKELVK